MCDGEGGFDYSIKNNFHCNTKVGYFEKQNQPLFLPDQRQGANEQTFCNDNTIHLQITQTTNWLSALHLPGLQDI